MQPTEQKAAGLFNMLRNEGGSLGIAIVDVLVDRRGQFHQLRLAEHVTPLNPAVDGWIQYFAQTRMTRGGVTRAVAEQQGMGLLSRMVHNQAREMAYLDPLWVFAMMALAALPLILLMKKAVAKAGSRCTDRSPLGVTDREVFMPCVPCLPYGPRRP